MCILFPVNFLINKHIWHRVCRDHHPEINRMFDVFRVLYQNGNIGEAFSVRLSVSLSYSIISVIIKAIMKFGIVEYVSDPTSLKLV